MGIKHSKLKVSLFAVSFAILTATTLWQTVLADQNDTQTSSTIATSSVSSSSDNRQVNQNEGSQSASSSSSSASSSSNNNEGGATDEPIQHPEIHYETQVQNIGWQKSVTDGQMAGTSGQSLRLEALKVNLNGSNQDSKVTYQAHVQNVGWQDVKQNGQIAGTVGKSLRVEAIRVQLSGSIANQYDIYYRTYVQNLGWLAWTSNNQISGTTAMGLRVEGIAIKLVPKGQGVNPETSNKPYYYPATLNYQAHQQNIGWQSGVSDGNTAGVTGRGLRLEALKASISSPWTGSIVYQSHLQNVGWQSETQDNGISGTQGSGLRVEAIRMRLTGDLANHYDVAYQVHVQNYGWLNWAKNGNLAGTTNMGLRIEAIRIKLIPKGENISNGTYTPFITSTANQIIANDGGVTYYTQKGDDFSNNATTVVPDLRTTNTPQQNIVALQNAFNVAKQQQKTVIKLPAGSYTIGSGNLDDARGNLTLPSNTIIDGENNTLIVSGTSRWMGVATGQGAKDGVQNLVLKNLNVRAEDMANGNWFMVMANHGTNWFATNNTFTMVQKMGYHSFDLDGLQDSLFNQNKFVGYAAYLTHHNSNAEHDWIAETIQIDWSNSTDNWDAGFFNQVDPYKHFHNLKTVLSNNLVITNNQFLPYWNSTGELIAYGGGVGQHAGPVGNILLENNTFESTLSLRYTGHKTNNDYSPMHFWGGGNVTKRNNVIK